MEIDSIECVSSTDGIYEEEIHHHHHQFSSSSKPHSNVVSPAISPATSVHELLECPVCTNSMYPPIHQCHNGHTLCSTCKSRVHNRCPTCRQELGDIRCLALEKVAESLELPCKYCSLGCPEIFPYYSKLKHEAQCNFRPYNCPYAGSECAVVGDIPFLVSHLRDDHKVDMHTGCTFNHRYVKSNPREVENATWMLTVFNCFGQYFCLHFEAFQLGMAPVYMAFLRFMGDEIEARNFSYSLEVGANGRKLIWEGTPRSIRDSHKKVRDSHDGLIIQRNMALFFSGGDRKELKLRVTGRIWKEQQNPDAGVCIPNLCSWDIWDRACSSLLVVGYFHLISSLCVLYACQVSFVLLPWMKNSGSPKCITNTGLNLQMSNKVFSFLFFSMLCGTQCPSVNLSTVIQKTSREYSITFFRISNTPYVNQSRVDLKQLIKWI